MDEITFKERMSEALNSKIIDVPSGLSKKEKRQFIIDALKNNQKDIDSEFVKTVDEQFWDLLE